MKKMKGNFKDKQAFIAQHQSADCWCSDF